MKSEAEEVEANQLTSALRNAYHPNNAINQTKVWKKVHKSNNSIFFFFAMLQSAETSTLVKVPWFRRRTSARPSLPSGCGHVWRLPSNSCTYQDKVLCSPARRRRCTSSRWTCRSAVLKIGAPSGDLLDVAQQSLTLKTRRARQWASFTLSPPGRSSSGARDDVFLHLLSALSLSLSHSHCEEPSVPVNPDFFYVFEQKKGSNSTSKEQNMTSARERKAFRGEELNVQGVWFESRRHAEMDFTTRAINIWCALSSFFLFEVDFCRVFVFHLVRFFAILLLMKTEPEDFQRNILKLKKKIWRMCLVRWF